MKFSPMLRRTLSIAVLSALLLFGVYLNFGKRNVPWLNPASSSSSSSPDAGSSSAAPSLPPSSKPAPSSRPSSSSSHAPQGQSNAKAPAFSKPGRMLVGYYVGWASDSGLKPDQLDVSGLSVLNYAFAKIGSDGKVAAGDPSTDYANFSRLRAMKRAHPGLKTVLSVGGWDYSGNFSGVARTASSRTAFAASAASFLRTNGFDGIDIDWEYPTGGGKPGNSSSPQDSADFRLLLAALRSRLDAQGAQDGKHYILSFAGEAQSGYSSRIGLSQVAQYVDYGLIMTYDLHGSWESVTDFNAPLYSSGGTSVDSGVRSWLDNGFPANKLILGVPFYGYAYRGVPNADAGLRQGFSSASAVGYDAIRSYLNNASYRKYSDPSADVPWLFNGSTFVSYDDAASLREKTQYAVSKHLLGVGAWNLTFDRTGTLLSTVRSALRFG